MTKSTFSFANLHLEIKSEAEIDSDEKYTQFLSEKEPNFFVEVKTQKLPEPEGKLIFTRSNHKCFLSGEKIMYYSSYALSETETDVDYACLEILGNKATAFVDYKDGLWYSMLFDALNIPFLMLQKGGLFLHCSCIQLGSECVLFTAQKQVGKSTQASLWEKFENATIVNGDRIVIFKKDGSLFGAGTPYCGSSKICLNKALKVKAIVCLSQGTENKIEPLKGLNAFYGIFNGITCDGELENQMEKASEIVSFAVQNVPVFSLECTPDERAVRLLKKTLESESI